jgi:hypothetical protein
MVEHVWREAVGEVEAVLATPVKSIKQDEVILVVRFYYR